jgi:hypothetical protein
MYNMVEHLTIVYFIHQKGKKSKPEPYRTDVTPQSWKFQKWSIYCTVQYGGLILDLFTFSTKELRRFFYIPSKSTENSKKKFLLPSDCFMIGHNFLGI